MAGPIRIAVLANASQARRELNGIAETSEKAGGRFRRGGAIMAAGAASAALAIGGIAVASVRSASDAQQSLGATETVFGKYANTVIRQSNRAADAVGLSANQYRESANLIGSLFRNQGVAADQLAGKTDNMVKLGADLAATYGGTTKDAVEALGSAFKGEFDPLEKYGISIKQSSINAELAARGQSKLTGAARKAAEQQAATKLIMDQAGKSVGAFGRESDTLAGQQQRLGAKVEDLKAKVGAKLLPILTKLATFASEKLLPALEDFGAWFGDKIQPKLRDFANLVRDRVVPVIRKIGRFVKEELIPAIRPLVEKYLEGARKGFENLRVKLKDAAPFLDLVKGAMKGLWNIAKNVLLPVLGEFYRTALPKIGLILGVVATALGRVGTVGKFMWNNVLAPVFRFMAEAIANVLDGLAAMFAAIGKVPGFGWAKNLTSDLRGAAAEARNVRDSINNIPDKNIKVTFTMYKRFGGGTVPMYKNDPLAGGAGRYTSGSPSGSSRVATYNSSTAVAVTPAAPISIRLSAEQVSQLQRGREIRADLDYYDGLVSAGML